LRPTDRIQHVPKRPKYSFSKTNQGRVVPRDAELAPQRRDDGDFRDCANLGRVVWVAFCLIGIAKRLITMPRFV
jgi:hypothetical protein